jgi:gliding motility-associated protein GldL
VCPLGQPSFEIEIETNTNRLLTMNATSKKFKKAQGLLYGIGASIVIIGALFKIEHWPFSSELLIIGLSTEALIFFVSAFETPHQEYQWDLVYPELAATEGATSSPTKKKNEPTSSVTEQLDEMLKEAKIEPALLERLGNGMRHLGDQAAKMGEVAEASAATKEYSASLQSASAKVGELTQTYVAVSESLTGLANASSMGPTVGAAMNQISTNLNALNDLYSTQVEQLKQNNEMYAGMGELVRNLNESVADTKAYKENIAELSKNLSALNTVYSNMLNAMNSRG